MDYIKKIKKYIKKIQLAGFAVQQTDADPKLFVVKFEWYNWINATIRDITANKYMDVTSIYFLVLATLIVDIGDDAREMINAHFSGFKTIFVIDQMNFLYSVTDKSVQETIDFINKLVDHARSHPDQLMIITYKYNKSRGKLSPHYELLSYALQKDNINNILMFTPAMHDLKTNIRIDSAEDDFMFWLFSIAFANLFNIVDYVTIKDFFTNIKKNIHSSIPELVLVTEDRQKLFDAHDGKIKNLYSELKFSTVKSLNINNVDYEKNNLTSLLECFVDMLFGKNTTEGNSCNYDDYINNPVDKFKDDIMGLNMLAKCNDDKYLPNTMAELIAKINHDKTNKCAKYCQIEVFYICIKYLQYMYFNNKLSMSHDNSKTLYQYFKGESYIRKPIREDMGFDEKRAKYDSHMPYPDPVGRQDDEDENPFIYPIKKNQHKQ